MPTFNQLKTLYPGPPHRFSDAILMFMSAHPDFYNSLKLANPNRFQVIPVVLTSFTPANHPLHTDEVIGIWYFDKSNFSRSVGPFFKQDFIVNEGSLHRRFVSYSRNNRGSVYVKPIGEFFRLYGSGNKYYDKGPGHVQRWQHDYANLVNLPHSRVLREWAKQLRDEYKKLGTCTI